MNGIIASVAELIELRKQAKSLSFSALLNKVSQQAGDHLSNIRGQGMEFDEVRHYQNGDDVRSLDWKVTARTNRPHTKLFREERERQVYLLLDHGPTMQFATQHALKSVVACRLAAQLAWTAHYHGDKVGLIANCQDHCYENSSKGSQQGILHLIKTLADCSQRAAKRRTAVALPYTATLQRAQRLLRRGALLILLSDFVQADNAFRQHLQQLSSHNTVFAIQILDCAEQQLPRAGLLAVSNGTEKLIIDSTDIQQRALYSEKVQQQQQRLAALFRQCRVRFTTLNTADSAQQPLAKLFGVQ